MGRVKKTGRPKNMGRPRKYSSELGQRICAEIASDIVSLKTVCSKKGMPAMSTVFRWLGNDKFKDFQERYSKAKQQQADAGFEKIGEIASNVLRGDVPPANARVAIDTYKWMLGKLRPEKYHDKLCVEHTGKIDNTLTIDTTERAARLTSVLAEATKANKDDGDVIDVTPGKDNELQKLLGTGDNKDK